VAQKKNTIYLFLGLKHDAGPCVLVLGKTLNPKPQVAWCFAGTLMGQNHNA
jgi:hypothetical protein